MSSVNTRFGLNDLHRKRVRIRHDTMTSSNGNIFRVTGHLCVEFTGHRWILRTGASDAELWCFLWSAPWINGWVNNHEAGDLRRHRTHYDVIVMCWRQCIDADLTLRSILCLQVKPLRIGTVMMTSSNGNISLALSEGNYPPVDSPHKG